MDEPESQESNSNESTLEMPNLNVARDRLSEQRATHRHSEYLREKLEQIRTLKAEPAAELQVQAQPQVSPLVGGSSYSLRSRDGFESWSRASRPEPFYRRQRTLYLLKWTDSGCLKFGRTTISVAVRQCITNEHCKIQTSLILELQDVPYAILPEKLLYRELKSERRGIE